ncbi:MAG: OmpA family protein [Chitinophagales bacterium]|nr:OmpA family protein [Chitinophagales bacterium]
MILQSCVPAKKLEDAQSTITDLKDQTAHLQIQVDEQINKNAAIVKSINALNDQVKDLTGDTIALGQKYRSVNEQHKKMTQLYEQTMQQNKLLLSSSSSEKLALNDSLKKKQAELNKKARALDSLQLNLAERELKTKELQSLLDKKDSATVALKNAISQALLGFEKSDLTVEQRNGRVYVSMAEKLLFKSGSTAVDPKGTDALQKLAAVLKKNQDINVEVEGHTDNVSLAGSGSMKDNWDLSVLRATSIIRILVQNGVNSKRVTASGHGEYFPVTSNESAEGRAKNRRTEIILSPRLNELIKLLGN